MRASGPNEQQGCTGPPSSSSWRKCGHPDFEEERDRLFHRDQDGDDAAYDREQIDQQRSRLRRAPRTSARKAKRFSHEDAVELVAAIRNTNSEWAEATATWFGAGILVGLRPVEWQGARIGQNEAGKPILVVDNAKHTNGRSHGDTRTLNLEGLDADQLELVTKQVNIATNYARLGAFVNYYERCREVLKRCARRLWPNRVRHPTLYTSRHMFTANAKSVFGRIEVAALLGHASADTAKLHYAQRRLGSGVMGVRPTENDIAAVAKRNPDIKPKPLPPLLTRAET